MLEYLKGFEKRMEFFAIVESIAKRRNRTDRIENMFEENQLDNLIMSVLVYIMEVTLTEEQECTLESIVQFVKTILLYYQKQFSFEEVEEITRYMVKDILQNKGNKREYQIMNYNGEYQAIPVRLVADKINENNKVIFELTKQGYDFLFRTKEVEDELGFEIEEIKLKMLIKKKNYQGAIQQSREIIRRLRNQKVEFLQFEDRLKSNINEISGTEYENLVNQNNRIIQDGYEEMKKIDDLITKAKEYLEEEDKKHDELDENIKKAKREVYLISQNVQQALGYQRKLLTQGQKLKKLYLQILEDTMSFSQKKRYNFEEQILKPLEKMQFENTKEVYEVYRKLVNPLYLIGACKRLNLNLLYDSQSKLKAVEEEILDQEEEYEENEKQKEEIRRRNEVHVKMIEELFDFMTEERKEFTFSQWFCQLGEEKKRQYAEGKRVFLVLLKLYEIERISISEFLNEETVSETCNGEFDLSYCLYQILRQKGHKFTWDTIKIKKLDDIFQFCLEQEETKEEMEMNDMKIVKIGEENVRGSVEDL